MPAQSRPSPLLLALLAACAPPSVDNADVDTQIEETDDTEPEPEPATASWMGDEIPAGSDDIAMRELLLPGTFNSSSFACDSANGISPDAPEIVRLLWEAVDPGDDGEGYDRVVGWSKAQDRSLAAQLLDGIRAIDVNLTRKDGALVTWHSVYGEPLDNALDPIVAFAVSHPSEVVLLSFGVSMEEAYWPEFIDALTAPRAGGVSLCDLLFTGSEPSATATLAEVRASGRNLIWAPSGDLAALFETRGDCPTAPFVKEYLGSGSTTTDGVIAKLEATVATRAPDVFQHNDFFFYLGAAASQFEQAGLLGRYGSLAEAMDALGFAGDFPGELIERFDVDAQMNIFSGGHYDRTNLVEAVIERTRTRQDERP